MPTRRIDTEEGCGNHKACRHPEHNPPSMRVFEPGLYEHECPACGQIQTFRIDGKYMMSFQKQTPNVASRVGDTSDDWVKWEQSR